MSDSQADFDSALRLRAEGRLDKAQAKLEELSRAGPALPALFAVLGDVYWSQGRLDKAIDAFRNATRLAPNSEVASLGLFHTLWESGDDDEAFHEMKRFMRDNESEEYTRLLSDLKG